VQARTNKEQAFVKHLRERGEPADLARLRRALGESDQVVVPAVEGFLARLPKESEDSWARTVYYLVAGLWASTVSSSELERFREQLEEEPEATSEESAARPSAEERYRRTLGYAIAQLYLARDQAKSIEQRFVALLDADEEQLPYRLRQMVRLLKSEEIPIHWAELLRDLLAWNGEHKPVQQKWARAFYRRASQEES
jgi:CRISPR system Cascade subunit CasB